MNAELRTLILKYLNGDLPEAMEDRLQELLREPGAIDDFVRLSRREAMLIELVRSRNEISTNKSDVSHQRPRILKWRKLLPLAAAASIAVIVVLRILVGQFPPDGDGKTHPQHVPVVVRKIGTLDSTDDKYTTNSDSYCLLKYPDQTTIAMSENTTTAFPLPSEQKEKIINCQAGCIYIEATPQQQPMTIHSGRLTTKVLGTRLMVNSTGAEYVSLFEGRTEVSYGNSSVFVRPGQRAQPLLIGKTACVTLKTDSLSADSLQWLSQLGLDAKSISRIPERNSPSPSPALDITNVTVKNGLWEVFSHESDPTIIQHNLQGQGTILIGEPNCRAGMFSFAFKGVNNEAPHSVGPIFFYDQRQIHSFVFKSWLRSYSAKGYRGWVNVRLLFRIMPGGDVIIPVMEMEQQADREHYKYAQNMRLPAGKPTSSPCGVGLRTIDNAVAFRNLNLQRVDTTSGRITQGQLALYHCESTEKTIIPDNLRRLSNMNLKVSRAEYIQRLKGAVRGQDMTLKDKEGRLLQAWKRNKGLTFEMWIKYTGKKKPMASTKHYAVFTLNRGRGTFNMGSLYAFNRDAGDLCHIICVLSDQGPLPTVQFYYNGLPGTTLTDSGFEYLMKSLSGPLGFTVFPSRTNPDHLRTPPETEFHFMSVYDHPMSPEEVLRNYFSGVPAMKTGRITNGLIAVFPGNNGKDLSIEDKLLRYPGMAFRGNKSNPPIRGDSYVKGFDLILKDTKRQLGKIWGRKKGLTFEMWFKYNGPPRNKKDLYTMLMFRTPKGTFSDNASDGFASKAGTACQLTCVLSADNKARFYSNGKFISELKWPWLSNFMSQSPLEIILFPSKTGKDANPVPKNTEMHFMAIYDRTLSDEEVRQNYLSGLPTP